jgi:hypothetical protein
LIEIDGKTICPVEFAEQHLLGKQIVDFVPPDGVHPVMLVFADGHTLPLVCAHCGRWLKLDDDEDAFLAVVQGRWVSAVRSAPFADAEPGMPDAVCLALEAKNLPTMEIPLHPDSIAQLLLPIPTTDQGQ